MGYLHTMGAIQQNMFVCVSTKLSFYCLNKALARNFYHNWDTKKYPPIKSKCRIIYLLFRASRIKLHQLQILSNFTI